VSLIWVILGVGGTRHAVAVFQFSCLLFKLRRVFEKPIAVRAIQEAAREASGPLSQFSPSYSLYFEVGFTGHEAHRGTPMLPATRMLPLWLRTILKIGPPPKPATAPKGFGGGI
jgi:hypothetical protein